MAPRLAGDSLDDKVVDTTRFERVSNRLGCQNTKHDGDRVRERSCQVQLVSGSSLSLDRENVPVNSNIMTASDTVVLVTPARVDTAPIMAHTPGKTQLCPNGKGPSSFATRQASKMASVG